MKLPKLQKKFAIEIWSFNQHLTDTLRYQQNEQYSVGSHYIILFTSRKESGFVLIQ